MSLPFVGHDVHLCPNISPSDRTGVLKACAIELDDDEEQVSSDVEVERFHDENSFFENEEQSDDDDKVEIQRVNVMRSPAFPVKINKVDVAAVIDSGATGSMIQLSIAEMANLRIYPTKHMAEQADGYSNLQVVGEVHTNIVLDDDLVIPISAVVVTALKEDILIGTPFMKKNKMIIDFGSDSIRVRNREIFFKDMITKQRTSLLKANVSHIPRRISRIWNSSKLC